MKEMFEFRDYQLNIIKQAQDVIRKHRFVYLSMEVRTGKTLTSLGISEALECKNVLFVTKKKAISTIEKDFLLLNSSMNLVVINYESLHKVDLPECDMLILDEAHGMGAFPKPSKRAKLVRQLIKKYSPFVCLLSGTPTPESYSQMYHQVYGIPTNPFIRFVSFYKFAHEYINVTQRKINSLYINDYTDGKSSIISAMKPMMISFSQSDAGFSNKITENILTVNMSPMTYKIADKLRKDLVVQGDKEVILADTPVKLMQKLHQIYSGTVKFEGGNSTILDDTKAVYIKKAFYGKKIGIFYKFKEELNVIKKVFGDDICTELSTFDCTNKSIALQIVSGREGISLRKADCLVYYNIDFSATSYWQSRDRMTTKERNASDVYWIFSKGGIEKDIYRAVTKKKDYTLSHFKNER